MTLAGDSASSHSKAPPNGSPARCGGDPIADNRGPTPISLTSVHFSPCAHTAWHRHSLGQTLCVTEREGVVQSRGGPLIRIRPGEVVVISGGEWHWHGAAPDHVMTHLALTEGDTEWGDHLADDEYPHDPQTAATAP